jgi:four helix bundle protein
MVMAKIETRNPKLAKPTPIDTGVVRDFTDLDVWKLGRELRKTIYAITRRFPSDEKHALTDQMRRAALSVTANVAEGFGRFSYKENVQFCRHARGSAFELRDHLTSALDAAYISYPEWKEIDTAAQRVIQVLNGYIRATQRLAMNSRPAN